METPQMCSVTSLVIVILFAVASVTVQAIECDTTSDCAVTVNQTVAGYQCYKHLSTCMKGYCACAGGKREMTVPGGTSKKCGKEVKVDEACDNSDTFCGSGAECSNSVCKCMSGYRATSSKRRCISQRRLKAESCNTNDANMACDDGGTECLSSLCQCPTGRYWDSTEGKCEQKMVGSACTSNSDCGTLANTCTSDKCTCDSNSRIITSEMMGKIWSICVHKNADVNIAEGEPCRMSYDSSDGKLCATPNLCTTCTSVHATEGTCTSPSKLPIDPAHLPKSAACAAGIGIFANLLGLLLAAVFLY